MFFQGSAPASGGLLEDAALALVAGGAFIAPALAMSDGRDGAGKQTPVVLLPVFALVSKPHHTHRLEILTWKECPSHFWQMCSI